MKNMIKKLWNWVFHTEKGLYLFFGALTTLVSLIVYYVFEGFSFFNGFIRCEGLLPPQVPLLFSLTISSHMLATVLRNVAGIMFAYFTNRGMVFGSEAKGKEKLGEFLKFISSRLVTFVLDLLLVFAMVDLMNWSSSVAGVLSQIVVIILNYVLSKLFVFKKKPNGRFAQK